MRTTLIINIIGLSIILVTLLIVGAFIYIYYKKQYNKYKKELATDAEREKLATQ